MQFQQYLRFLDELKREERIWTKVKMLKLQHDQKINQFIQRRHRDVLVMNAGINSLLYHLLLLSIVRISAS